MAPLTVPKRLTVAEQLYLWNSGYRIYVFYNTLLIIPVPDNVYTILFNIHPSVPYNLVGIIILLFYPHGIYFTTGPVILLASMMCIGIRKNDIYTSGTDTTAGSRPAFPVFIPTNHILNRMGLHIVVISRCGLAPV